MHKLLYVSMVTSAPDSDIMNVFLNEQNLKQITGMVDLKLSHKNSFIHVIEGDSGSLKDLFVKVKEKNTHKYTMIMYDNKGKETSCYVNRN